MDKCNTVMAIFLGDKIEVTQTEMFMDCDPYTVDEYHETFCEKQDDKWIFIGRKN